MEHSANPSAPAPGAQERSYENIAAALRDRQFFICLQPKFSFPQKTIVGAEALLRWNDPEEGILFPAEFLPAAQRAGHMETLDLYAVEEACRYTQQLAQQQLPAVPLSVNISAASLHAPGFCEAAIDCLSRYGIPPTGIEFEFSAQFAKDHPAKLSDMIQCMHRYGFYCCIDGFCEDAGELEHLCAFEVDTVKLNCRTLAQSHKEYADVCTHALNRAKQLDMRMLCESVEHPQQMDALAAAGCELMQGYALSMPVSTGLFTQMLRKHAAKQ